MSISGLLVGKSYHVSNEVYLAMLSRGYHGEPVTMDRFRLQTADYLWAVFALVVAAVGLLVNYFRLAA
jgi:cobalt/nickel transport system permease protein